MDQEQASASLTEAIAKAVRSVESLSSYSFKDPATLVEALTHSSYFNETVNTDTPVAPSDNERLEFLGDAVIGLVVARGLMERFRTASEGLLSRWRSQMVSRKTLAEIAQRLGLGDHVLLGKGERRTGGAEKRSILSAAFEAVVAALYLDGGIEAATQFLERVYQPLFNEIVGEPTTGNGKLQDSKTLLQERSQAFYRVAPTYRVVESWGPEHEKFFRVEIAVQGKAIADGYGRSKKEAEQNAARVALELLGF
ncbi:MAG: ribonuclease III [Deltaproteobacteria bacterium]|nr:ribonuclease III [Deltaproteobacteria bacterium]MBI3295108.1 ribonuclease III [Deltaproteobacteria bacterium]